MAVPVARLAPVDSHPVLTRARWAPVAIFAMALLLRLAFLAGPHRPLRSDEIDYDRLGWTLASTRAYQVDGHPTAYRPIGYPAFLAVVYSLAGHRPAAVKIVQAVLDSCTAVLLFVVVARRNRRAGALAGAVWALLPAAVLFSSQLFTESLLVFALAGFVYLADTRGWAERRTWATGLFLGALMMIRPLVTGFFAVGAPVALLPGRGTRRATMLAFAFLPVALWALRNLLAVGAPVLTTSVGVNLFIGNHARATGSYAPVDPSAGSPSRGSEVADDAAAYRAALDAIAREPARSLARVFKKALFLLTSEGELAVGHFARDDAASARYRDRYRSVPVWIHLLVSLPTFLLIALGTLGLATRPPDRMERLFWALLLATFLSCAIFFGGSRFRFPLLWPLAGFAGEFLAEGRRRVRALPRRRLAAALAVILGCAAVWAGEAAWMASAG